MSSGRVFVTSDTHFGHPKVTTFRPWATVEEHDRELIARWNSVVGHKDTVWHLGDVWFGGRDNHAALYELHGHKKLILGNHDTYPIDVYQNFFWRIYGAFVYKGHTLLTHIPVHECQFPRFKRNVHGHLHAKKIDDPRYRCVSLEHTDYKPILLSEILA